jgi:hypothetical protein
MLVTIAAWKMEEEPAALRIQLPCQNLPATEHAVNC